MAGNLILWDLEITKRHAFGWTLRTFLVMTEGTRPYLQSGWYLLSGSPDRKRSEEKAM